MENWSGTGRRIIAPTLGIQHPVEGNARSRRNPGGKDESVRAGADGFFLWQRPY